MLRVSFQLSPPNSQSSQLEEEEEEEEEESPSSSIKKCTKSSQGFLRIRCSSILLKYHDKGSPMTSPCHPHP